MWTVYKEDRYTKNIKKWPTIYGKENHLDHDFLKYIKLIQI